MLKRETRSAQFSIRFNGPVGSTQYNDCNFAGACTDQTLAYGGPTRNQRYIKS